MKSINSNNILIIMPFFFEYHKIIKEELERSGSKVYCFNDLPSSNVIHRALYRFDFRKFIKRKKDKYFENICNTINADGIDVDYLLIIAPEYFCERMLVKFKEKLEPKNVIIYLWDSIQNKKINSALLEMADRAYSFDPKDCDNSDGILNFLPLFYSQRSGKDKDSSNVYDLLFVGTVHSSREIVVNKIKEYFGNKKLHYYIPSWLFFFYKKIKKETKLSMSEVTRESLNYDDYMSTLESSKYIVDVCHTQQSGLTMRTFEALAANTKLITTNRNIREYDFYSENNIFVLEQDDFDENEFVEFLKTDFISIEDQVFHKYSLSSWLANIFK